MCGIAGLLHVHCASSVDGQTIRSMANAIAHRGPDAEGYWFGDGVALAHRRLSIIDLVGGEQPMANEDGSVQVVFNGEIYNYPKLRDELVAGGHTLRTSSDTEVLVHLYEDHGAALVEHLRGMFAFALWDDRKKRLLLARDRIGQKPLYYYRDREKLLFGSEIKAILAFPGVDRSLDQQAIEAYLAFGAIPGELSIFKHIKKLPAGNVLEIEQSNLLLGKPKRYWQLNAAPDDSRSLDDWIDELQAKFSETVEAHRIADVPVGAFLSGGVDSSAMVAEMAANGADLKTFSIGFEEEGFSELPFARLVAKQYKTDHVEEIVTADAVVGLQRLVDHYDEPFADPSAIPTMRVAEVAQRHVKVVVSGDGGDEAFGGYSRYAHDLHENAVRQKLPIWLRRHVLSKVAQVWPTTAWLPRPLRAKTALTNVSLDPCDAYANTLALFRRQERYNLVPDIERNGYRPETAVTEPFEQGHDFLQSMTTSDIGMMLPDTFLTKVDRASMAVGLEVRPPMVDHEFLELAVRAPSRLKIRDGETKWIFKRMQEGRLPNEVIWRKKQGFDIPVDAWLRGPLREQVESVLRPGHKLSSVIERSYARRLYDSHLQRRGDFGRRLWALLVLGKWLERYATAPQAKLLVPTKQTANTT